MSRKWYLIQHFRLTARTWKSLSVNAEFRFCFSSLVCVIYLDASQSCVRLRVYWVITVQFQLANSRAILTCEEFVGTEARVEKLIMCLARQATTYGRPNFALKRKRSCLRNIDAHLRFDAETDKWTSFLALLLAIIGSATLHKQEALSFLSLSSLFHKQWEC